jgi:hypothetical protein
VKADADADAGAKVKGKTNKLLVTDGEGYMCWMVQKLLHNRGKNTRMGLWACESTELEARGNRAYIP